MITFNNLISEAGEAVWRSGLGASAFIALCVGSGLAMRYVPGLRTKLGMASVGLLAIIVVYRDNMLAYYAINIGVFAFTGVVDLMVQNRSYADAVRWRWSLVAICALIAAFLAQSIWPQAVEFHLWGGVRLALVLDMWLLLRLVSFLWEYGAGQLATTTAGDFAAWCSLPFTCSGPLLRFRDFQRQSPWTIVARPSLPPGWWRGLAIAISLMGVAALVPLMAATLGHAGRWGRIASWYTTVPWGWYLMTAGGVCVGSAVSLTRRNRDSNQL